MKKYLMFFKVRFASGLQYRMASVTALTTQLIWGIMECLAYKAIAEAMGTGLPMEYSSIVTYVWLKEAFLALFLTWTGDKEIFALIQSGGSCRCGRRGISLLRKACSGCRYADHQCVGM